jgi:ABC-type polysaccharide/polyol phosphate transport system ATPase subunit
VTFLVASDSAKQFRRFCDRAILLDNGHVAAVTSVPDAISQLRGSRRRVDEPNPFGEDSSTGE